MGGLSPKIGDAIRTAAPFLRPPILNLCNSILGLDLVQNPSLAMETRVSEPNNREPPNTLLGLVHLIHFQELDIERLRLGNTRMPIRLVLLFHRQSLVCAAICPNEDCCTTDAC